jgi:L-methionine (R)-S-oxide reductase
MDSKSEVLDELRYKIGILGDLERDPTELIEKSISILVSRADLYSASQVYVCRENGFYLLAQAGGKQLKEKVEFGLNPHSLCAIRAKRQVFIDETSAQIHIPCYIGHHLLGQLVVFTENTYHIDQDDFDFLREVVQYIKSRLILLGTI